MHPKKKIVVVDDNEINAKMLEEFLSEQGYDVALAFSASDGLKTIAGVNPHLIVLDLFLPDMKGSQVCVQLRAQKATQNIPIIMCTAHNISQSEKMQGFKSGVDDYLVRPFELSELLARIEALLRRASPHFQSEVLAGIDALLKMPPEPQPSRAAVTTIAKPPEAPEPKQETIAIASQPAVEAIAPMPVDLESFHPLQRVISVLNHPYETFRQSNQHEDLLISLMLILGTPMIATLVSVNRMGGATWLYELGTKISANLGAWFVISGVLYVTTPFLGKHWSFQRALSISGLSWAPKIVEAIVAVFYAAVAPIFVARVSAFSSGLDLLTGTGAAESSLLSTITVFSLWSVGILLIAVWKLCAPKKKFNSITITIALIALLCAMVAHV